VLAVTAMTVTIASFVCHLDIVDSRRQAPIDAAAPQRCRQSLREA
jgi:hypothetical protein